MWMTPSIYLSANNHRDQENTMSDHDVVGVGDYNCAAAGWGALKAVAYAVRGQMAVVKETRGLLTVNQPHGFDCPGLRLARSETCLLIRVPRKRRESCVMGGDRQTHDPEFFAAHMTFPAAV
jgi:hypothetical protein